MWTLFWLFASFPWSLHSHSYPIKCKIERNRCNIKSFYECDLQSETVMKSNQRICTPNVRSCMKFRKLLLSCFSKFQPMDPFVKSFHRYDVLLFRYKLFPMFSTIFVETKEWGRRPNCSALCRIKVTVKSYAPFFPLILNIDNLYWSLSFRLSLLYILLFPSVWTIYVNGLLYFLFDKSFFKNSKVVERKITIELL